MPDVQIRAASSEDPDFVKLVGMLDHYLAQINGEEHGFYSQHNKSDSLTSAVVAYWDDEPVGCGGTRRIDDEAVEVKRMFVRPDVRRTGAARAILVALERGADESGYRIARLETSKRMVPAVNLYASSGYSVIPNYGPYVGVEDSVCMEKSLAD
jgi:putative acetyltransferase